VANVFRQAEMTDVVVVGCGAGGSVVAKELAEAGLSVVVLEVGRRYDPLVDYRGDRPDFPYHATRMFSPEDPRRDHYTSGPLGYRYSRIKGVGGTTLVSWGVFPRFHASDFQFRALNDIGTDWPITYAELEPYYCRVESELGVAGADGAAGNPFDSPRSHPFPTPAHPMSLGSQAIDRGARQLGLHPYVPSLAVPTKMWGDRPACIEAGACGYGCRTSAMSSADVTYVRKAERTRRATIRPLSTVREISVDAAGLAKSAIYFDSGGVEHEIKARAFVLAANAIETPRLLLLSQSTHFPNGLANSSGLVGKYLTEHLDAGFRVRFPRPLENWKGVPVSVMIQDYYETNKKNAFVGGWLLEGATWGNTPVAAGLRVNGWGAKHKREMKHRFGHELEFTGQGVQIPDVRNCVSLDRSSTDNHGIPVPYLVSELRGNDLELLRAMQRSLRELMNASGAEEVLHEWNHIPGASSHYMGTCRMGTDPQGSVVNSWGRTHDVANLFLADSSVFVSSGPAHPMPTLMALATRTAERMVETFRRGEL
jgi:choline dehydrogenase-like flavoprotein